MQVVFILFLFFVVLPFLIMSSNGGYKVLLKTEEKIERKDILNIEKQRIFIYNYEDFFIEEFLDEHTSKMIKLNKEDYTLILKENIEFPYVEYKYNINKYKCFREITEDKITVYKHLVLPYNKI